MSKVLGELITLCGKVVITGIVMVVFYWLAAALSIVTGLPWSEVAIMGIVGWWLWREGHSGG